MNRVESLKGARWTMLAVVGALLGTNTSTPAQTAPARHYDKPLWTSAEGFSFAGALRELKDGRVIITDIKDVEIWLLSNKGERVRQIGRRGGGPEEFQDPMFSLALPNDSTLVVDGDQQRFLLIDPDGKPVRTVAPDRAASAGVRSARGVDQRGRVYFPMPFAKEDPHVPLLRWDRAANRVDTVATLVAQLPGAGRAMKTGDKDVPNLTVRFFSPFPSEDGWTVLADGTVLIVRAPDYHVELIPPNGAVRKLAPLSYARVAVTPAEIKRYATRVLPEFKPAFSAFDMQSSPDGEVWVRHYPADGAKSTVWDVLSAQGARIATVEMPSNRGLLALTRTKVYFYRTDADGLQWIEAYTR